jgi:phosphoglycerate dehydrogenase-like enzyme
MGDMAHFNEYLAKADIVASCLPDTPETYHIYDAARFAAMKKGAYFVNVGRGTNVDQAALQEAVAQGHLAGAALDVTDPEPLPSSAPLWKTPGIYITPHISGGYHLRATHDYIVRIAADNLKRYRAGDPLENIVDLMTGYKA